VSALRKGRRRGKAPSKRAMRGRRATRECAHARMVEAWAEALRAARRVGEQWEAISRRYAMRLAKGPT